MNIGKIIQHTQGGFLSSLATLSTFIANWLQSLSFLHFNTFNRADVETIKVRRVIMKMMHNGNRKKSHELWLLMVGD